MGFTNEERTESKYITIIGGRLAVKTTEGAVGAESRINKNGDTVWEKYFKSYDGIVKGWAMNEFEFNGKKVKSLNVHFDDMTLSLSGKMKNEFIKKFAGAVQDKPITISPYPDFVTKDGKAKKSGLTIRQDGEKIYDYFTEYKDGVFTNRNGFPAPPKKWADMSDADRQIYNIQCDAFLERWVEEHPINNIGARDDQDQGFKIEDIPY